MIFTYAPVMLKNLLKISQKHAYPSDGITLVLYDPTKKKNILNGLYIREKLQKVEWFERPMVIDYTGSNSNFEENLEISGKIPTELEVHVYKSTSSKNVYGIIDISYYEQKEKKENLKWVLSGKVLNKIKDVIFLF